MLSTPAQPTREQLRRFGLLVGGVLVLLGGWQWYRDIYPTGRTILGSAGGAMLLSGLLVPAVLAPVYRVWMKIGHTLGAINTRILIGLIFFVVITPIACVVRLFRIDLLRERFDRRADSYWNEIEPIQSVKEHCERQF